VSDAVRPARDRRLESGWAIGPEEPRPSGAVAELIRGPAGGGSARWSPAAEAVGTSTRAGRPERRLLSSPAPRWPPERRRHHRCRPPTGGAGPSLW